MRPARSIVVTTGILFGLLSIGPEAAGGGGSTFDFSRRWFAPGQTVHGTARFADGLGQQGRVKDGPYFAYLAPGEALIEPPRLPREAVLLGRVRMRRLDGDLWVASVRFVVPDVRPGTYAVSLCNDPCRYAFVGDLMGAWISVAASAEQANVRNLEDRIAGRVMSQVWDATAGFQEQIDALTEQAAGGTAPATGTGITVGTELRVAPIEDQLVRLNAQVRGLEQRTDEGMVAWLWLAGWIVAAGMAIAWRATVTRRRRAAGPRVGGDLSWHVELERLEAATQE